MTVAAAGQDLPDDFRERAISLPTNATTMAELLKVKPWLIIAELMEAGMFARQQTEISDVNVVQTIGQKHGVRFKVTN
jgi:hypothetical protein